jgi:sulfur-carrier protein adenylyltransferase/sulfurtransferase
MLNQSEQTRYSCQMKLPNFGENGQNRLKNARILIVGMGGLGCPAAQYLVASGVGFITLADFDVVSEGNLHRQILFSPSEIGQKKAEIAAKKLQKQNPHVEILTILEKITTKNVLEIFQKHDLILDCTDNFETRYLINDAAFLTQKPVVFAAIYQFEGQLAVWNLPNSDGSRSPNFRDLFPEIDATQVPDCSEGGVISPLAGIMGCLQANEAIKIIVGFVENLAGKLLTFDALTLQMRTFKVGKKTRIFINNLPENVVVLTISFEKIKKIGVEKYQFIDVRTTAERLFNQFESLFFPLDELANRVSEIPREKSIVFFCASGRRSDAAARIFLEKYPNSIVYSLEKGIFEELS